MNNPEGLRVTDPSFLRGAILLVGVLGTVVPLSADAMAQLAAHEVLVNSRPGTTIVIDPETANLILRRKICVADGNFAVGSKDIVQESEQYYTAYDNTGSSPTLVTAVGSPVVCVVYDGTPEGRKAATERAAQVLAGVTHESEKPVEFQNG